MDDSRRDKKRYQYNSTRVFQNQKLKPNFSVSFIFHKKIEKKIYWRLYFLITYSSCFFSQRNIKNFEDLEYTIQKLIKLQTENAITKTIGSPRKNLNNGDNVWWTVTIKHALYILIGVKLSTMNIMISFYIEQYSNPNRRHNIFQCNKNMEDKLEHI